jgi:predicted dehydrogenase
MSRNERPQPGNLSRRRLLKASALAAGAVVMGGPQVLRAAGASGRLNVALVGCGGQGRGDMKNVLGCGENIVALCDPDEQQIAEARKLSPALEGAKAYADYRKLLDAEKSLDAVIIGTPDHWHAPLCTAFLRAGKHVYCEKPLTHTIAEARDLRALAKAAKAVTQLGNQGSATASVRRGTEVIRAGALGQVRDIYIWGAGSIANEGAADGEDPVPPGLNWDLWCGPSPVCAYKKDTYHPQKWRGWYAFGNGGLADMGCHGMNLPQRALDLGYPDKVEIPAKGAPNTPMVRYHFAARKGLDPVAIHWLGSTRLEGDPAKDIIAVYKEVPRTGCLIIGEKGSIFTDIWNKGGLLKLADEPRLTDITRHAATQSIPESIPRTKSHQGEWCEACKGQGKTYSDFEIGGLLTEITLSGIVALRVGRTIEWDGEKREVKGAPEAAKFVKSEWRKKWIA